MARGPATHEEIITRVVRYAGDGVVGEIKAIVTLLQDSPKRVAIERLATLDGDIGGFGIHTLLECHRASQQP